MRLVATSRRFVAGGIAGAAMLVLLAGGADAANTGFVRAQGEGFVLDGQPFRFVGTNAYYMAIMTALGSPAHADDQIAVARALGFTVMRTWGYADGPNEGVGANGFQPAPGVYNEQAFRALDYVLYKADLAGLRLLIPLVDGNSSYGGVSQYATWCAGGGGARVFFEHAGCQQLYKSYVSHVLNRRNTYNGRLYKDDPTVFAWELANEPHLVNGGDPSGQLIRAWVAEMAAFFKSLDGNHLVSTGEEGYDVGAAGYGDVGAAYSGQAWLFDGNKGIAFSQNTADPNIDYGSIHVYPEFWNLSPAQGRTWIADHIRIARALGKPLVLGEFGASQHTAATFTGWLQTWQAEHGAGALAWQVMCQVCYGMRDQFGILYPQAADVTGLLAATAADVKTPDGPTPTPTFTVAATTVTPNPVAAGQAVTASTSVTATAPAGGMAVVLEVHDAGGATIAQEVHAGQSFGAGETRAYAWTASGPLAAGPYTVAVAVYDAITGTLATAVNPAASFAVLDPAAGTPPRLDLQLNQTSFRPGDPLVVAVSVTPGSSARPVDVYLLVRLPDGRVASLQADGTFVGGVAPIVRGWVPVAFAGEILRMPVDGASLAGDYAWITGLAVAGTATPVQAIEQHPFTITP